MCYDISFIVNIRELKNYFPTLLFDEGMEDAETNLDASTHIIGHSYGDHPIIYSGREDKVLHCRFMEWGCIPYYIKDEKQFLRQRATMLNARSERILGDDKSYWFKIRNRRCLIPVSGFYEHRTISGWKKKVPYFITLTNQPVFFIPGLYSVAELPDAETGEVVKRWTYTLITRPANELMKHIHNDGDNKWRMPLLLPFEMSKAFVADDLSPELYKDILHYEMPPEEMSYRPVFTIRSPKPRPDNKPKNEYWEWEKLPELGVGNPE
ncbi:MAG TPA: SOS response-associated peptidase family protein [Chitinophagaceae bacterium]|nr:SOS response-associated peptidase family protein [Chitinophagaceae bacterium]